METTTFFRAGEYELVKAKDGRAPYAIFKNGEQVSQWYCSVGWPDHKLKKLLKTEAKMKTTDTKILNEIITIVNSIGFDENKMYDIGELLKKYGKIKD